MENQATFSVHTIYSNCTILLWEIFNKEAFIMDDCLRGFFIKEFFIKRDFYYKEIFIMRDFFYYRKLIKVIFLWRRDFY